MRSPCGEGGGLGVNRVQGLGPLNVTFFYFLYSVLATNFVKTYVNSLVLAGIPLKLYSMLFRRLQKAIVQSDQMTRKARY